MFKAAHNKQYQTQTFFFWLLQVVKGTYIFPANKISKTNTHENPTKKWSWIYLEMKNIHTHFYTESVEYHSMTHSRRLTFNRTQKCSENISKQKKIRTH